MADVHTMTQRSYNMSRIRGSGTKPELKIRSLMRALGFAYQPKGIMGRPDFANRKEKIVLFVDGCFWHNCPRHGHFPRSNKIFWRNKLLTNMRRDKAVTERLKKLGWKVVRIWECKINF